MKKIQLKLVPVAAVMVLLGALAQLNRAQTPTTLTRVLCVPDGPVFHVDGSEYAHAMSAFWPMGSKHTLDIPQGPGISYNPTATIRFRFTGWEWSGGSLPGSQITVIASPAITEYRANFSVEYQFGIQYFSCTDAASCAGSPGVVLVNGVAISSDQILWQVLGTGLILQASPNPGWIFAGWRDGANQTITGFQNIVTVNGPMTVYPVFVPAKTVNFATNPPNLKMYTDGILENTPTSLDWGLGTTHAVAAPDSQQDVNYDWYIFSSWSDGGAESHTYRVGTSLLPETLTANFTPGYRANLLTIPGGLNLKVDGLSLPPSYSFIWGVGQTHHVEAPLQQTDPLGGVWKFTGGTDGVTTAARDVTGPPGSLVDGVRMLAVYTGQARMSVTSNLLGLMVSVDGTDCATPCTIARPLGTKVRIGAPSSIPAGDGSRQDFLGWTAGSSAYQLGDWVVTMSAAVDNVAANYHLMNRLATAVNPSAGATLGILPASPDGFYDSQSVVTVSIAVKPGYRFSNWTGDLGGTQLVGTLEMQVPRSVAAQLNSVPFITPTGVVNAAGSTPQPGVAAGSVATIFGANLTIGTDVGPANPLVQTLAGATVRIGSHLLPLYFASPEQLNLQIPPDLAPGPQTLTVSSLGLPDVSANFVVARNAPGLFPMLVDGQAYALAFHEDGTLVSPDSPAKRDELLTVYGTGFGPTDHPRPEGFAVPLGPPYVVVDPVTVLVGTATLTPEAAFAAPARIGVDLVQFRLDGSVAGGGNASLHLRIKGVDSNTLLLPVQ